MHRQPSRWAPECATLSPRPIRSAALAAAALAAFAALTPAPVMAAETAAPDSAGVSPAGAAPLPRSTPVGPRTDAAPLRMAAPPSPACGPDVLGTERTILIDAAAVPLHLGLKTYPQTLALADHEVVLTFDDGPSAKTTPAILQALSQECVHATFFLIGRNARAHPALVRREIAEGHTVGHHSMTHPASSLRFVPEVVGRREIDQGIEADEAAGWPGAPRAADRPHVPFFRFPGFADTPALLAHLDGHHVAVFGCDLWAGEWTRPTPEQELESVLHGLETHRHRGLIMFHDIAPSTAAMLPAFLQALKTGGYKVVTLSPGDGGPPGLDKAPPGWTSETEAVIARRSALLRRSGEAAAGATAVDADPGLGIRRAAP